MIDPRAAMKVQPELMSGESLLWAGMPNPNKIFHSDDWYIVPFSLVWGGFALFWEAAVSGHWGNIPKTQGPMSFMMAFGMAFVVVGQYLIWGRFLYDAWLKRRTYYAVTNRRVLTVQDGWIRRSRSTYLEAIPEVVREGNAIGTLWLGAKLPLMAQRGSPHRSLSRFAVGPGNASLADIDDVDSVHRLIMDWSEKARQESRGGSQPPT